MAVNDDVAVAEVEALLRRTLHHKAAGVATPSRVLVGASGPTRRRLPDPRRRWTAVAACAVVVAGAAGIVALRTARDDGAAPATAPATTTALTTTTVVAAVDGEYGPDPDGPHSAYGTIRVSGGMATGVEESLTLVGDDVDTAFRAPTRAGDPPQPTIRNRRVDGVLYVYLPQADGSFAWTYDSDDTTTLSLHPTGHTPFELYGQVADHAGFEEVGPSEIDGIAVRHLRATTPAAVDAERLRLGSTIGNLESLELWVTDADVVLRVEATIAGDPPTSVTVEFIDVGNGDIELDSPEGATEIDAVGLAGRSTSHLGG